MSICARRNQALEREMGHLLHSMNSARSLDTKTSKIHSLPSRNIQSGGRQTEKFPTLRTARPQSEVGSGSCGDPQDGVLSPPWLRVGRARLP